MKKVMLFLMLFHGIIFGQGYVLSLKLMTLDGRIIGDTTPNYKIQVKFSELGADEFLNIRFDPISKTWNFHYGERYAGGTYLINIINSSADTMSIIFNTLEPFKTRKYYVNLFIDNVQFVKGTYYIEYPGTLSEWNSLITLDYPMVHSRRFYDITEFQSWVKSNYYDIVPSDSLVGVWQDNKVVGAGWSNTYLFFKDGSYKFFFSQMDCAKRVISYTGTWNSKGEVLSLNREEQRVIVGGRLVRAQGGSCLSDSMLVDGHEKSVTFTKPKTFELALSRIFSDSTAEARRPKIYIDAIPFWKFIDDPKQIIKEFEYR